jgi:glucose-like phosphotransferase system IIB component
MEALDGEENLKHLDACFTRLRVEVAKVDQIQEERLKELGAAVVVKVDYNIQAIFGGRSDLYNNEINRILKDSPAS